MNRAAERCIARARDQPNLRDAAGDWWREKSRARLARNVLTLEAISFVAAAVRRILLGRSVRDTGVRR